VNKRLGNVNFMLNERNFYQPREGGPWILHVIYNYSINYRANAGIVIQRDGRRYPNNYPHYYQWRHVARDASCTVTTS